MQKSKWLDIAEILDALRVVPRAILVTVIIFTGWYIVFITLWYFNLPVEERQYADAGFLSITIPGIFGLTGKICQWYLQTGKKWGNSE